MKALDSAHAIDRGHTALDSPLRQVSTPPTRAVFAHTPLIPCHSLFATSPGDRDLTTKPAQRMATEMHKTTKRLLGSFAVAVAVVGVAAAMAGLGTFATFTSSTSASHTISSGAVSINLGTVGAANRLTVGASNVVPGDTIQRAADLINNGGSSADNLSGIVLTTTASPTSLHGLQLPRLPAPIPRRLAEDRSHLHHGPGDLARGACADTHAHPAWQGSGTADATPRESSITVRSASCSARDAISRRGSSSPARSPPTGSKASSTTVRGWPRPSTARRRSASQHPRQVSPREDP